MAEFDQIPETARAWIDQGRRVALATVVATWGSAPRQVGAQLVIDANGAFEGSVSGGCVEGAVVLEAVEAIATDTCRLIEFGVSDEDAFAVGLACGGTIRVLVEPVDAGQGWSIAVLDSLLAARAARKAVAVSVDLTTWVRRLIVADDPDGALRNRFAGDFSGIDDGHFIAIHNPPLRLIIVGAVHIAQALVPMARLAGYDVVLCDPRGAFAAGARFPGIEVQDDWPDEVVMAQNLDARSALVTLAHDPKIDDPAIFEALKTEAFYIGCLGSRRTHAKRLERLRAGGVTEEQIGRIYGPAGLDIGARGPAEIAVSVLAQMVEVLRQRR